jgi:hypothetical protein
VAEAKPREVLFEITILPKTRPLPGTVAVEHGDDA